MTCFGATDGSIDITVEGGCEPYSFAWSNGETTEDLNNIGAGIYTVTATDPNGLTISLEIEITEPAELTATETISSYECGYGVTCFGATDGSIDITVEVVRAYTFAWSNGETTENISNLGVGTYSVDITDANGCTFNIPSIEITEPAELTITETHSSYECEYGVSELGATDGSIDITVEGGCEPYSFAWSNGETTEDLNNIGAGIYTVTATDANGCFIDIEVEITEPAELTITETHSSYECEYGVTCFGATDGSIDITNRRWL